MVESLRPPIQIDLNEFKLHLHLKGKTHLTLHFNSPSRRFYLSVIALAVNEMKRLGKIKFIPLQEHLDLLVLLNETIGGAAGSSDKENLLPRIYKKWKDALPNLEEAPLFKVLGRKKEEGDGAVGKVYSFTDVEKDGWANLFEYVGSEENVRLKFAIDKIGVGLNETSIVFGDSRNGEAWDQFIARLKKEEEKEETAPVEETAALEPPAVPLSPPQERKPSSLIRYRWVVLVVVIGIVAGVIWRIYLSPAPIEVASVDRMKYPLPDEPSIAVLPFANMSEDPKQEFLCDGMTEAIITALSKAELFVIARNSTFIYKGKPVKVNQVSEELGVRYVLEGSLQRSGDRLRITVQLIDALQGNHLWADRYDRDLKDIFALQDEITIKILNGVRVKLTLGGEVSRAEKYAEKYYRGKQGLDCYLKLTQAYGHYIRWSIHDNNLARPMVEEAIAMCPENPMGYIGLGWIYHHDYWLGNTKSPRETLEKGIELAQKALGMDDSISEAHSLLCAFFMAKREYDKAILEGERAVGLNPGGTNELVNNARSLVFSGRPEEAIPLYQKAIRLNPIGPSYLYREFGYSLRDVGRFEEAVSAFRKAIQLAPDDMNAHTGLAVTYSIMGREKDARAEAAEILRINPKFSVDAWANKSSYRDQSQREKVAEGLRKAGLK
jgi:adenylate cyclase